MNILCIGEMLIDFTPVSGMERTYTANPGGAPANVAVSAARNGVGAGFLGKLGDDDFGRLLRNTLKKDNVEILIPKLTDKATTTLAFVTLDENGDRSFTFARKPGADMLLSEEDVKDIDYSKWDIVHAGSVSQSGSPEKDAVLLALKKESECGRLVSFDINYRDKIWGVDECMSEVKKVLPYVDLLKISDEELVFVGGEDNIPSFMRDNDMALLTLTLGGDGARIYLADGEGNDPTVLSVPAMKVDVTDTTGAGDAYWGGFLSSLLRQGVKNKEDLTKDIVKRAAEYGAVSGGLCIQKPGGIPALPYLKEIEKIIGEKREENR